jgi:anti-sigma B factor antagonist
MDELEPDAGCEFAFELASGRDGILTVRVSGELDLSRVDELDAAVDPVLVGGVDRLVIDATELRFADSSAIALWVKWASAVPRVELRDPSPLLTRIVQSMGLGELLHVAA